MKLEGKEPVVPMITDKDLEGLTEQEQERFKNYQQTQDYQRASCAICSAEGWALTATTLRLMQNHPEAKVQYSCMHCARLQEHDAVLEITQDALDLMWEHIKQEDEKGQRRMAEALASSLIRESVLLGPEVRQDDPMLTLAVPIVLQAMQENPTDDMPLQGRAQITLFITLLEILVSQGKYASAARQIVKFREKVMQNG